MIETKVCRSLTNFVNEELSNYYDGTDYETTKKMVDFRISLKEEFTISMNNDKFVTINT